MYYSLKITSRYLCSAALALLLAAGTVITSCEQVVTNITLPHEERIVIEGLLEAGKPIDNIFITRTQPPLEETTPEKAYLQDAEVRIKVDNQIYTPEVRFDTLRQSYYGAPVVGNGTPPPAKFLPIYSVPGLRVQAGKTYQITVRWQGKTAQATATIPTVESSFLGEYKTKVTIDTVSFQFGGTRGPNGEFIPLTANTPRILINLEAPIRLRPGLAHDLIMYARDTVTNRTTGRIDTFVTAIGRSSGGNNAQSSIIVPQGVSERTATMRVAVERRLEFNTNFIGGQIVVTYRGSLEEIREQFRRAKWYYALVITETSYFDWLNSSSSARFGAGTTPFSAGGTNPVWNVSGDGIGIFAGTSGIERPIQIQW
ncbi:MAG: DUF4249 family protein [Ignavibacteria bacterium]|nr:DUF4249 family protein [Ignavibacteria bacterium]